MKRFKTLRARTEKYTDKATGQEKQGYITVGHALKKGDDTVLKIDSIPVGFDGWLYLGDLPTAKVQEAVKDEFKEDADIPF